MSNFIEFPFSGEIMCTNCVLLFRRTTAINRIEPAGGDRCEQREPRGHLLFPCIVLANLCLRTEPHAVAADLMALPFAEFEHGGIVRDAELFAESFQCFCRLLNKVFVTHKKVSSTETPP